MEVEKNLLAKPDAAHNTQINIEKQRTSKKKRGWKTRKQRGSLQRKYLVLAVLLVLSCSVYLVIRSSTTEKASPTLKKVFICFRHGSRVPNHSFKEDKFKNIDEVIPEGRGKLTKEGKREAYALGKRLRERYGDFLGPYYKSEEVKPYTTIMERSMMSGLLVMASFFPPNGYQIWNEELNWQPVPMYPEYIFNASVGASCPYFIQNAYKNAIKKDKMSSLANETIALVKNCSGETSHGFLIFNKVWDSIYFQSRANLPLRECFQSVFPEKMSLTAVELTTNFLIGTEDQRKLLLWNYAEALRNFFHSDAKNKMEIHSWHDLNNLAMLYMLRIDVKQFPEPTSCIAVELHEKNGQNYFETYYYNNYKSKEPKQLEMECGMSCSIDEINKLAEQYKVENYTALCENSSSSRILKKIDILA